MVKSRSGTKMCLLMRKRIGILVAKRKFGEIDFYEKNENFQGL